MPKFATCDFCKGHEAEMSPMDTNALAPKDWLCFTINCRGRLIAKDLLMCPGCQKTRNIEASHYKSPTLTDALLEELYDGICDMISDQIEGR